MTDKKVSQRELEVKHSGRVIECGTLDVFLSSLTCSPVFVMPLRRVHALNGHEVQQWCVHLTACPLSSGPIYYCTFAAAELLRLGHFAQFTFPVRNTCNSDVALGLGDQLQQELLDGLYAVLGQCLRACSVVVPARYRLPDEWVWSTRSTTQTVVYRDDHWKIAE